MAVVSDLLVIGLILALGVFESMNVVHNHFHYVWCVLHNDVTDIMVVSLRRVKHCC